MATECATRVVSQGVDFDNFLSVLNNSTGRSFCVAKHSGTSRAVTVMPCPMPQKDISRLPMTGQAAKLTMPVLNACYRHTLEGQLTQLIFLYKTRCEVSHSGYLLLVRAREIVSTFAQLLVLNSVLGFAPLGSEVFVQAQNGVFVFLGNIYASYSCQHGDALGGGLHLSRCGI